MKRWIACITALCLLFALGGCGEKNDSVPEAEACVRAYFEAIKQADFAGLDATLNLKKNFHVEKETEDIHKILVAIGKKVDYEIKSSQMTGDGSAEVVVSMTMPKLDRMIDQFINEYISIAMKNALNGSKAQTTEEMLPALLAIVCDRIAECEVTTRDVTIPVAQKDGVWSIQADAKMLDTLTGGAVSTFGDVYKTITKNAAAK